MQEIKLLTDELLDRVVLEARENPRLRKNYNFHDDHADPVNRMLNALEPGTYLPPHRHQDPDKTEIYLVLRGRLEALLFDDQGEVTRRIQMGPGTPVHAIEIPPRTWHTILVQEPGTVIYEIKEGPYVPLSPVHLAPWAPSAEDKEEVLRYMQALKEK